jgi:uncharacterized protein
VPIVAVFDTIVLLSVIGWTGAPYQCVELARSGTIEAVTCHELLDELSDKLQAKLSFSADEAIETIADLLIFLRVVQISGSLKVVAADPDDDKVIGCAIVAGASHLMTGDRRHLLPIGNYQGVQVVNATDFLQIASMP